jgi:hypothetical protein
MSAMKDQPQMDTGKTRILEKQAADYFVSSW